MLFDLVKQHCFLPLHAKGFMKFLADVNLPEQFIQTKNGIKHLRSYKSSDRSAQREEDVSQLDDDNVLEDFQRQWRILKPKQTNANLKKSKHNLQTKPYSRTEKYSWKTI